MEYTPSDVLGYQRPLKYESTETILKRMEKSIADFQASIRKTELELARAKEELKTI